MEVRIGVVSDTHLFSRRGVVGGVWDRFITRKAEIEVEKLFSQWKQVWGSVDTIFHAGDLSGPYFLALLKEFFPVPVVAVRGNADKGGWSKDLPVIYEEVILGHRIGMVHGGGSPKYIVDRIGKQFGWKKDCIIFGHTHQPFFHKVEGVWFFNPGSPTDRVFAPYPSIGILTLKEGSIQGEILRLG